MVVGLSHPLLITGYKEEISHRILNNRLNSITLPSNNLKRKKIQKEDNMSISKRRKTGSHTNTKKIDEKLNNNEQHLVKNQSKVKLAPLLRVDKVSSMISVLNHPHMNDNRYCHDKFEVLIDIEVNEEVSKKLKDIEVELNMRIAKFLHFKRLIDKKMPILSLQETKEFFFKNLEKELSKFEKQLDVTIKLKCCGTIYILDQYSVNIPAKVIAQKVENVKLPLIPLPAKDKNGHYIYSKTGIKDQLKKIYRSDAKKQ